MPIGTKNNTDHDFDSSARTFAPIIAAAFSV
jgi:hypothetical protein